LLRFWLRGRFCRPHHGAGSSLTSARARR
jgi:hypothetical protein